MKKILTLCFFLFSISLLNAQIPEWIIFNSSNSGLPGNNINTLVIDSSGNKRILKKSAHFKKIVHCSYLHKKRIPALGFYSLIPLYIFLKNNAG